MLWNSISAFHSYSDCFCFLLDMVLVHRLLWACWFIKVLPQFFLFPPHPDCELSFPQERQRPADTCGPWLPNSCAGQARKRMAGWSWKSWDLLNLLFPFGPGPGAVRPGRQSPGGMNHLLVPSPKADCPLCPPPPLPLSGAFSGRLCYQ